MVNQRARKRIVWIDEDTDIIGAVVRPLEQAGHEIVRIDTAGGALTPAAIEAMRSADLVLLDMILPPGDTEPNFGPYAGREILRQLRTVHGVTTPVLVLSVVTNPELREAIEALGVSGIVRKPVLPSELKRRAFAILFPDGA
jgi:CheY-like chemotaxis protein